MSSSNDLQTVELIDEIENILFLCDRLDNRLTQITSYVDEIKQTWLGKRRSIELEPNISPIIVQKAVKCNKVLLNAAEKLAAAELQTEMVCNLHSSVNSTASFNTEKQQVNTPIYPSTLVIDHESVHKLPSNASTVKNELVGNRLHLQRDTRPTVTRPLNVKTNSSSSTPTARNSSTLFSEAVSVKTPVGQQQSVHHRGLCVEDSIDLEQAKLSTQNPFTLHKLLSKTKSNGSMSDYQHRISNMKDPYSCIFSGYISL